MSPDVIKIMAPYKFPMGSSLGMGDSTLVDHQNVVGWFLLFIFMRTLPTHYYLESSGQETYMETHPTQS